MPTAPRTAFVNARLIDPETGLDTLGGLLVNDGVIVDIGAGLFQEDPPGNAVIVECGGDALVPGLVDMRVRIDDAGAPHKETFQSASRSACRGGVTSFACLPDMAAPVDDLPGLEFVASRARKMREAKIYPYATVTAAAAGKNLSEMALLTAGGAVAFTDGQSIADAHTLLRALSYASALDALIVQHPENRSLAENGVMNAGELSTRLGLPGIPPEAEVLVIERDLRLVAMSGGRLHFAPVTTAAGIEAIRRAKAAGLPVSAGTAPPYFSLTEVDVGEYRTFARLSPPLRTDSDRRAVVQGLADGTIDVIASDHWPQDQDSKRVPFAEAAPGMVGLETLLPLTLELVHRGEVGLARALEAVSYGPARLLGLPQGRLRQGAPADLALIALDRPWQIDVASFASKAKNSLFDERPVMGRVRRTYVDGRAIFRERS